MAEVLCITGMHRSGTSLTASWIQRCGLQIDNGNLIGAAVGNESGHFEDKDFVDLHSRYIIKLWPGSKNWIVLRNRPIDEETRRQFIREATRLIESRNDRYQFWGWKDPRSLIFLDIWKQLIPNLKCLLIWRDARDVASSLTRRSRRATHRVYKIDNIRSILLWKFYNEMLLEYHWKNTCDSIVANIQDIVEQDRILFDNIVNQLGLRLKYSRIQDLVRDDLLKQASSGGNLNLLCGLLGTPRIESTLRVRTLNIPIGT